MGIAVHLDVVGAIVVETLEDVVCDDKEAGDRPSIFTEGLLAKRFSLYTEFYSSETRHAPFSAMSPN